MLPVVARKRGLDGLYEQVGGGSAVRKVDAVVPPVRRHSSFPRYSLVTRFYRSLHPVRLDTITPSIDRRLAIRFRWMSLVEIHQSLQRQTRNGHSGKNHDHRTLGNQISYGLLKHQRRPSSRHTMSDATRDHQRKMADCTKTHKCKTTTTTLAAVNASLCDICSVCVSLSHLFLRGHLVYSTLPHSLRSSEFDLMQKFNFSSRDVPRRSEFENIRTNSSTTLTPVPSRCPS